MLPREGLRYLKNIHSVQYLSCTSTRNNVTINQILLFDSSHFITKSADCGKKKWMRPPGLRGETSETVPLTCILSNSQQGASPSGVKKKLDLIEVYENICLLPGAADARYTGDTSHTGLVSSLSITNTFLTFNSEFHIRSIHFWQVRAPFFSSHQEFRGVWLPSCWGAAHKQVWLLHLA